jgi:hypothetical protein
VARISVTQTGSFSPVLVKWNQFPKVADWMETLQQDLDSITARTQISFFVFSVIAGFIHRHIYGIIRRHIYDIIHRNSLGLIIGRFKGSYFTTLDIYCRHYSLFYFFLFYCLRHLLKALLLFHFSVIGASST